MSEMPFLFVPYCSDHDLVYGYVYGSLLNGHGAEFWVVRPLCRWLQEVEAELERRGLRGKAETRREVALLEHHRHPVYCRIVREPRADGPPVP
jgi:hypothetical protein